MWCCHYCVCLHACGEPNPLLLVAQDVLLLLLLQPLLPLLFQALLLWSRETGGRRL